MYSPIQISTNNCNNLYNYQDSVRTLCTPTFMAA